MRHAWLRRFWEHFSICLKLPALFLITLLVSTSYFSWYGYRSSVALMADSIDGGLDLATLAVDVALPEDYCDRAASRDGIGAEEYARVSAKLRRIAENEGIEYLYALTRIDGRFYTIASNKVAFLSPYDDDWEALSATERDGLTRYSSGVDSYVSSRSVIRRSVSPGGRPYFIGADIPLLETETMQARQRAHYFRVGLVSFFLVGLMSVWVVWVITNPLRKLSNIVERFCRDDFHPDQTIVQELLPVTPRASDEVKLLAKNFHTMQGELAAYVQQLTATTAARERAESEMRIAGDIQQGLLSHIPLESGRVSVWGEMAAAREAAGDFYDSILLDDDRVVFVIGDVSGKGVPAAMFMSTCLTLFRAHIRSLDARLSPGEFLERVMRGVDAELSAHNDALLFVTCQLGITNARTGETWLLNAGHPPPVRVSPAGTCEFIHLEPGIVLGVGMATGAGILPLRLAPGEMMVFYTDGLTEALSPAGELFGDDRALDTLRRLAGKSAREVVDGLFAAMRSFSAGREPADDLAVVSVRFE